MNNPDSKFDNLMHNLQKQKPDLRNPAAITDDIMTAISNQHKKHSSRSLFWVRISSGAAAVFLLTIFILTKTNTNGTDTASQKLVTKNYLTQPYPYQYQENKRKAYFNYMQRNSIKNKKIQSILSTPNFHNNESNS